MTIKIWKKNEIVEALMVIIMNLKNLALQLCTCTWIEIMTGAGVALYLLHLQSYNLAALTTAIFAPLIGFHFMIDKLCKDCSKSNWGPTVSNGRLIKIRPLTK
jgi:hypothetical protein